MIRFTIVELAKNNSATFLYELMILFQKVPQHFLTLVVRWLSLAPGTLSIRPMSIGALWKINLLSYLSIPNFEKHQSTWLEELSCLGTT
jgi:hypothetical protein